MPREPPSTFLDHVISGGARLSETAMTFHRGQPARWIRLAGPMLLFAAGIGIVLHQLQDIHPAKILVAAAATPGLAILLAVTLTVGSYACLTVTEKFALTWLGHGLPWGRTATVAVAAYAVSNTVGFSLASGGMVRMRMYRPDGLSPSESARVTVLAGAAVSLSGIVVAGIGLAVAALCRLPTLPGWTVAVTALTFMAPASLWFLAFRTRKGSAFTSLARAVALFAALGDWVLSGAALYCLLPHPLLSEFPAFIGVYVLGSLLSAASGVPGGIGVFEAVVLTLSGLITVQVHETAAALLLYRLIYGFGPLTLTLAVLGRRAVARRALRGGPGDG